QNALTNTGAIAHSDQFDSDLTNNTDSITATPVIPTADLVLSKTADQPRAYVGSTVTYTFIIRDLGPDAATGVVVSDPFPAGLVIVSFNPPSQGSYDPVAGIWTVGTLASGAVATLQVTARVLTIGTIVNSASASAVEIDPDLANNAAAAGVVVVAPPPIISQRLFLASTF